MHYRTRLGADKHWYVMAAKTIKGLEKLEQLDNKRINLTNAVCDCGIGQDGMRKAALITGSLIFVGGICTAIETTNAMEKILIKQPNLKLVK